MRLSPRFSARSLYWATTSVVILILVILFSAASPALANESIGDDSEMCLVQHVNTLRTEAGLHALVWSGLGLARARTHASAMRATNVLFHSSNAEVAPTLPTGWTVWGEVVGMASIGPSAPDELCDAVFEGLMASPPHQKLLMSPEMTYITVGADVDSESAWYSTTLFDATDTDASDDTGTSVAPGAWFDDDDDLAFESDIEWLASHGITNGCSPTRFCPSDPLTRGQMAAFLVRGFDWPGSETQSSFEDMNGHMFDDVVARLAEVGVTKGCSPTRFCPDDSLTRGELAAFLARALQLTPRTGDHFYDDDSSMFEGEIEALVALGITGGCGEDIYCPDDPITRGEMAAMLRRALDR